MNSKRVISLFLSVIVAVQGFAQGNVGTGPKEKSISQEVSIRKQQRKEAKERRKREKQERKAIKKHHKRIQTKKVNRRMKESRKSAIRNNEHRREPFYKRWFKKKNRARAVKKKD
jgi:hypothetical protein